MRFSITLNLGDLVEWFPFGAFLNVLLVHPTTGVGLLHGEHPAIGEVAVVGDSQRVATGAFFVIFEPLVELERIGGAHGRLRHQWYGLNGATFSITQDDVAVQVVALGHGRPFVTNERSEVTGVVIFLGLVDDHLPQITIVR